MQPHGLNRTKIQVFVILFFSIFSLFFLYFIYKRTSSFDSSPPNNTYEHNVLVLPSSGTSQYNENEYLQRKDLDAIIVLGGGAQRNESVESMPVWCIRRLELALKLFKKNTKSRASPNGGRSSPFIINCSAGTFHKPFYTDPKGFTVFEAKSMTKYLLKRAVPAQFLFNEYSSYDTIGNAYFSRILFSETRRLCNLSVVTSNFHMKRSKAIFEWVFSLPMGNLQVDKTSGNPSVSSFCKRYQFYFDVASDDGLDPEMLEARRIKEEQGLKHFEGLKERIKNMEELHGWLYSEHKAYCSECEGRKTVDYENKKLMDSY